MKKKDTRGQLVITFRQFAADTSQMQRKCAVVENPRSIQAETSVAKLKNRKIGVSVQQGVTGSIKETHTVVTKRDLHTTSNRRTKTRKAKAELVAGHRRLRKLLEFRRSWRHKILAGSPPESLAH